MDYSMIKKAKSILTQCHVQFIRYTMVPVLGKHLQLASKCKYTAPSANVVLVYNPTKIVDFGLWILFFKGRP